MATPRDTFVDALRESLHAARKFERALTKMAEAARNDKLRSRLFGHRDVTGRQIERIEEVFGSTDRKPSGRTSPAADALAREVPPSDLEIVLHAIKIEHFELAAYKTLTKLAEGEKMRRARSLLEKNASESAHAANQFELMVSEVEEEASQAAS